MHTSINTDDTERIYKVGELAKELDRRPLTIKRWESLGLIPKAKRDSKGWRYYTVDDVKSIVRMVKENNYFLTRSYK
ncbi:MAG: MerR family transcriptional regulator [Candidatus Poribacteria bacterium]|nr:MerR family transcriptional regulator [Candidatus Poribacteria bacterium]